jgi:hypothetical protein
MKKSTQKLGILVLAAMLTSGCVPLALGAAAGTAGGYYWAEDASNPQKIAETQRRKGIEGTPEHAMLAAAPPAPIVLKSPEEDRKMQLDIAARILANGLSPLASLQVFVDGGRVILTGTLPNRAVADRAYLLAQQTQGVKEIVSNIYIIESETKPVGDGKPLEYKPSFMQSPVAQIEPQPQPNQVPPQQQYFILTPAPSMPVQEPMPMPMQQFAPVIPQQVPQQQMQPAPLPEAKFDPFFQVKPN